MKPPRCSELILLPSFIMSSSTGRTIGSSEGLLLRDNIETAALLEDSPVYSPHHDLIETETEIIQHRKRLPWWRRPSPLWILVAFPFSTMAFSATMAPKVEIFTQLACRAHKPELFGNIFGDNPQIIFSPIVKTAPSVDLSFTTTLGKPNACASDPIVQAAVARFNAGKITYSSA